MAMLCRNGVSWVNLAFFAIILVGWVPVAKAASPSSTPTVSTSGLQGWVPPTPVLRSGIQIFTPEQEEVPLMVETIVEGTFVDPFDEGGGEETSDPWEPYNSTMFDFNYNVDRYFFKPLAQGWDFIMPTEVQNSIANAFRNVGVVPRLVNNLLQGNPEGAGIELQRFLINSTIGIGGFFDVAKYGFEIEPPHLADTGQTLAVNGVGSGPYLVVPFLPPTTVRDGFGFLVDTAMNPLNYFVPLVPSLAARGGKTVNERSRNLELFQGVEDSTVDLYGAVRTGYFERRARAIERAKGIEP